MQPDSADLNLNQRRAEQPVQGNRDEVPVSMTGAGLVAIDDVIQPRSDLIGAPSGAHRGADSTKFSCKIPNILNYHIKLMVTVPFPHPDFFYRLPVPGKAKSTPLRIAGPRPE